MSERLRLRRGRALLTVCFVMALVAPATPVLADDQEWGGTTLSELLSLAERQGALGIYLDASGTAVVVMPYGAAPLVGADFSSAGLSIKVAALDATAERLAGLRSELLALAESGDRSLAYAFYLDLGEGVVKVQTSGTVDPFAAIAAKYEGLVEISGGATVEFTSRLSDSAPFFGGASLSGPSGLGGGNALCSSGYPAKTSTTTYLVTAGHCFALNGQIWASQGVGTGNVAGTVTKRDFPTYDAELISGKTYSPVLFSGACPDPYPPGCNGANADNTSTIRIYGKKVPVTGKSGYCRSGQSTGKACGWTISSTDAQFCVAGVCTYHLIAYTGGTQTQGGDSGGPIYYPYNGGALISATNTGTSCTIFGCTYYGEGIFAALGRWNLSQVCYSTCVLQ